MICPKCGNEQPDVFSQCQKCRYIFPASPANVPKRTVRPTPQASAGMSSHPAIVILGSLFVALILGLVLWWLNSPEGLPQLEGSYVNTENQFAMLAPSGWMKLTADTYEAFFDSLGDRFPKMLRQGLASRNIEVGFMNILPESEFSPSVNVVVMKTEIPALDEAELAEGAKVLSEGFRSMLDNYVMERSELVTVDELTSAQFTSRGSLKVRVQKSETESVENYSGQRRSNSGRSYEWKDFEMKFVQTLIPGKGRSYILTSSALTDQYPQYKREFDSIVESFRVLHRPGRFGAITMGALNGGLVAALGYLILVAVMRIVGLFKREESSLPPPSL